MLARTIGPKIDDDVRQRAGEVLAIEGSRLIVRLGSGSIVAERAVSCLLAPLPRDRVLVASAGDDEHYVLAVLRRPGDGAVELSAPGDLRVTLPNGRLTLEAREGVALATPNEVDVTAKDLRVRSAAAELVIEGLALLGSRLEAHLGELRAVAGGVDAVFERVVTRMKHAHRFVEDTDRLDAGEIEMNATGLFSVEAHDAVVHAEQLIKLDGDQVHVG